MGQDGCEVSVSVSYTLSTTPAGAATTFRKGVWRSVSGLFPADKAAPSGLGEEGGEVERGSKGEEEEDQEVSLDEGGGGADEQGGATPPASTPGTPTGEGGEELLVSRRRRKTSPSPPPSAGVEIVEFLLGTISKCLNKVCGILTTTTGRGGVANMV